MSSVIVKLMLLSLAILWLSTSDGLISVRSFDEVDGLKPVAVFKSTKTRLLSIKPNNRYRDVGLFCAFYTNNPYNIITQVTVSDKKRKARYRAEDQDALESSKGYFTDVWSPDEEYLVLPKGRFEGFCIIKAREAVDLIQKQDCTDFIRVSMKHGPALWHEFIGWEGDHTLVFSAGLSQTSKPFRYYIDEKKVAGVKYISTSHVALNKNGRLEIVEDQ